jgi:hypothetical protein
MKESILNQIMALKTASQAELREKYAELHEGKQAPTTNKTYLWRRIAYRLQEIEYGGLSEDAQARLSSLIQEYDPINNKGFRPENPTTRGGQVKQILRDRRLPIPGSTITKDYKGVKVAVKVLEKGFEYRGKKYASLSIIAREVTGAHWNGYKFFNL